MATEIRYAIVVGIDQYHLEGWCLNTAVSDALKFASWAITDGMVAAENLTLLLSPKPDNKLEPGDGKVKLPGRETIIPFEEATRRRIIEAIEYLRDSQEACAASRLFFYYAGHGSSAPGTKMEGRPEPVLIPADVKSIAIDNNLLIGFSEIMQRLYEAGPFEHFFFVDACRDFALEQFERGAGSSVGRYIGPTSPSQRNRRAQYLLYATSPGQRANELGKKLGAGIFGELLLSGLQKNPGALRWNPEKNRYQILFSSLSRFVTDEVSARVKRIPNNSSEALVQVPQPDQTPGSPDTIIASFEAASIPPLPLRVRVDPSVARPVGRVQVSYFIPGREVPVARQDPPLEFPQELMLRPGEYAVQVDAPSFSVSRRSVNLNKPLSVDFELEPSSNAAETVAEEVQSQKSLTIRAKDRNVGIFVWSPNNNTAQLGLGEVLVQNAVAGIYKVQMILPDGPGAMRLIEFPRDGVNIYLDAPPAVMGQPQMDLLKQKGIATSEGFYLQPSEVIGPIADARVASLLGFAAYATYCIPPGQMPKLKSFGLKTIPDILAGNSWITILIGASGVAPTPAYDASAFVSGSIVAIISDKEEVVSRGVPQALPGFPSAAEFGGEVNPGAYTLELRLPGFSDTRYAVTALANRATVFVLVVNDGGGIDVQEYIFPVGTQALPHLTQLQPQDLRLLDAAQRYYAGTEQMPAEIITLLLNSKMIDPVGACLAGYVLIRHGHPERYIGQPDPNAGPDQFEPSSLKNMLKFFAAIPDSHILAGLAQPERKKEHFDNALELGLPLFLEGFGALRDYYGQNLPERYAIVQHTLLVGSPWTAWTAREPILAIKQGRFVGPPIQWKSLEGHRTKIQGMFAAVGALELIDSATNVPGTAFLISPSYVLTSSGAAERILERLPVGGQIRDLEVYFNSGETLDENPSTRTRVIEVRLLESERLAILKLASPCKAEPLTVGGDLPSLSLLDEVYIVGYPVSDSRDDPDAARRATNGIYRQKRLQPGIILETPGPHITFDHSCFTLMGNGGSPVIHLNTGRLVGVHWGGWNKSYNRGRATALSLATKFLSTFEELRGQ